MSHQDNNGHNGHNGYGHNGYVDTDMFDLRSFLRIVNSAVRHHKLIVLSTCFITLAVVTWYVYVWPPIYRVEAQLAAEREADPARDTFYSNWQVFRKEDPRDEVVLFTAGTVLRDVIKKNNLTYDDIYHPFLSHAGYLWEKSWLGRTYKSLKDRIAPESDPTDPAEKEFGRIMDDMKAGIRISAVGDTHIATLEVSGPNRRVADIANSLIDSYLEYRLTRHREEAESALKVLDEEANRARGELEHIRDRREAFAKQHGLMVEFQKESLDVKELTGIETNISQQSAKIASLQASLNEIDGQLRAEQPVKVLSSTREINSIRESAELRRLEAQSTLIGLRSRYREDSPEVREAVANLAKLEAIIAQEPAQIDRNVTQGVNSIHQQLTANRDQLQSELQGARASLSTLESTETQMRGRLTKLPGTMSLALDLNREYDVAAEKYQRLLFRKMEAQVSVTAVEASPASVKVVDYARTPSSKYWPKMKYLYPGALLVGLMLGTIAAVLRSLTGGRLLRTHVEQGRIAAPVYATIALGGRTRSLKVVPRQSELIDLPAIIPPKEVDRS